GASILRVLLFSAPCGAAPGRPPPVPSPPRGGSAPAPAARHERRARGFVGFAERALGFGQTVGRGAPRQRGGFDLADQTLPLGGKLLRRIDEFGPFRIGLVGAPTEPGDLRRRVVAALAPRSPLLAHRREPVLRA